MGKMAYISTLVRGSVVVLLASYLAGCSSLPSISLPSISIPWSETALESNPTAEALLEHGKKDIENKRYARAIDKFEKIRDEFPFSSQANEAELKIAEAHYLNKQYPEAASGFKDFLALHPTNKNVPLIIYHLGLVYFDQFTGIDRDQKNIETAKGYFETLIKEHPNSSYLADAKEKLAKCREYLAGSEFYVASFYLREKKYSAARDRFKIILRRYRDTPVGVMALYELGEIYRVEKHNVKAALAYEALIQHYPDSPLAKNARIQLSQLDKEDQDPLAILLLRDGGPVFISPPGIGEQKGNKQVARVAKTEVVEEEGGVQRGFFRSIADTVNPFSSSDEEPEQKEDGNKKKENGKKKEGGFLSLLWPFGEAKEEKGKTLDQGNGQLVNKVDESLKEKGLAPEAGNLVKPPSSGLPEIEEKQPPSKPAEALRYIDGRLNKEGKGSGELPPPPEASSKLFGAGPAKTKKIKSTALGEKKVQTSTSTRGLLDSIDKGLTRKGMELPQLEPIPAGQPKGNGERATRPQNQEKIELTPRLSTEKNPLLDAGDFQAKGRLEEEEKKIQPTPDKPADSPAGLPASLVKGSPPLPSEEKPSETKSADKKSGDKEKGALDQVTDDLKALSDLLNPLKW